MGLHMPPPPNGTSSGNNNNNSSSTGGNNHNNDNSNNSNNNNNNNNNNPKGTTTIRIPNPSHYIPRNPSMGLKVFGPLVPSADNVYGLYFLTSLQFGIGCVGFHRARMLRSSRLHQLNIPNTFLRRLTKYFCVMGGSYLIFQSGLELTRLVLPYDPWNEEAKFYRRVAIKNGDKPNWWFGAFKYYEPMSFKEWNRRVEAWIVNAEQQLETEGDGSFAEQQNKMNRRTSSLFASLSKQGKYKEMYENLSSANEARYKELMEKDLAEVNDLNKAKRIDAILEDKSTVKYDENFPKPPISFGNHTLETDEEFETAWVNIDPWEELQQDLVLEIRLIPGCEVDAEEE